MNLNETFGKDAKWIHISHSKGTVAGHYMITNSSSTKCVHSVRSEDVTAMLLMIQFYWDVMQYCWQEVPSILELLYPEYRVITFLLNDWNYSPSDSVSSHRTLISH
jgi:hypothetical protein